VGYPDFRTGRSALHLAGLLHGAGSLIWSLNVGLMQLCTGVDTDNTTATLEMLQATIATADKFSHTPLDYAATHGAAVVSGEQSAKGHLVNELPTVCSTEATCAELKVCLCSFFCLGWRSSRFFHNETTLVFGVYWVCADV